MPYVTPTGDANTFSVTSADDPDHYFVDTSANKGRMACTCGDWHHRRAKLLLMGEKVKPFGSPNRNICKHINAVLTYLGQCVVARANGKERTDIFEDKL
jgi:hypothetical protein